MQHNSVLSAVAIAAIVATVGCNPFHKNASEIERADIPVGERWNATLATPSGLAGAIQVKGSGYLARGDSPNTSKAVIHISNATQGGIHPWQLRSGHCGTDGQILGDQSAYPDLKVDKDGTAQGGANLNIPFPTSGAYSLQVLASRSNLGTVIACGNLAPPVQ